MSGDDTRSMGRREFLRSTGAAGAAAALASTGAAGGDGHLEVLVGVSAGASVADVEGTFPEDATVRRRNEGLGYALVEVPRVRSTYQRHRLQSALVSHDAVRYAEPNYRCRTFGATPAPSGDPQFDRQWAPQEVNAPAAWEDVDGQEAVTVAVVDQGTHYDHPDLRDRFGDRKGRDFLRDDDDPAPADRTREYHGTFVSGIAAASTGNGEGVAGVSDATLLACRALDARGQGSAADVAEAIEWATDQGADVINLSLGWQREVQTIRQAVSYAANNGSLPVAAAGNDGTYGVAWPARYEEVLAVGAVNRDGGLAQYGRGGSQYGPGVDVVAPGKEVRSTWSAPGRRYKQVVDSGTSSAAPVVAGVAALVAAAHPGANVEDLRNRLKRTASDLGLPDVEQGAGLVDAARAVAADSGGGDAGDDCGDTSRTTTIDGSLSGGGDDRTYTYASRTADPCAVEVSLSADTYGDFDLYLTLDGRTPTTDDFDRRSYNAGPAESITVTGEEISGGARLGILVNSYQGGGDFTLTVRESGGNSGDNRGPTARAEVAPSAAATGDPVAFDASNSVDPDGSIQSYEWTFGDGTTGHGSFVEHAYEERGEYTVELTVTDDEGRAATDSVTVSVGSRGCGNESNVERDAGTIDDTYGEATYTYETQLAESCQLTVVLDGPGDADFDLYLNTDGTTPTPYDADHQSTTQDSQERVVVDDPEGSVGILVDPWSGTGEYTLRIQEMGE